MKEVDNIREAILSVMADNPDMSKYRIAKRLGLSTSSHVTNYVTGETRTCRPEVKQLMEQEFNIRIK